MNEDRIVESRFFDMVVEALRELSAELRVKMVPVGELQVLLAGPSARLVLELSKGHVWQVAARVAPLEDAAGAVAPSPGLVPLGFVLEELTNGIATYAPRWLQSTADLGREIDRIADRLRRYGAAILGGEVDWRRAQEAMRSAMRRASVAASGRSRTARLVEVADLAYGRDEFDEARRRYENLGDELSGRERGRLEFLRER